MKLRPVEQRPRPAYPTMDELLAVGDGAGAREVVGGTAHRGWGLGRWGLDWGKGLAGAAVFFLAFHVGGCDTGSTVGQTVVAPVFDHGVGRGSAGCVVITPPSFLSEEEAMAVIKDELSKHGITLGDGEQLKDVVVQIPYHDGFGESERGKRGKLIDPRPLDVDAIDKGRQIAVVFVSESDCTSFEDPTRDWCSVSSFAPKKVATDLAASARKSGDQKRYVGFFYDPLGKSRERSMPLTGQAYEDRERRNQKECKELLRQQVRDFAAWLETQAAEGQHEEESQAPPKST